MGIFDPSFPDVRTANATRRAAIQEITEAQITAGPMPTIAVEHDDLVFGVDQDTGALAFFVVSDLAAAGGTDGGTPADSLDLITFRSGTAAAWASANPVLAVGEPGYEEDTGVVKVGDGATAWLALAGGLRTAKQTAQATNNTTGASTDIPGLSFAVQAGHRYFFKVNLTYQSDTTTTGFGVSASVPALTSGQWRVEIQQGGSGTSQYWNQSGTFGITGLSQSVVSANTNYIASAEGHFEPSADGTLQVRFRTEVEGSTVTAINAGIAWLIDAG
jgi:hypothetical protein